MAGVRRAKAYSKKNITPYTRRSKIKSLNYIKAMPQQKIVKFFMGNISKYNQGQFKNIIKLISEENVAIRDMSLEATRQMLHNRLQKKLLENYYLSCNAFPHHVLRNNRVFSGGSKGERIQSGMQRSFGTAEGRAAIVSAGKPVFVVAFSNKKDIAFVRDLCRSVAPKLPCKIRIVYEEIK